MPKILIPNESVLMPTTQKEQISHHHFHSHFNLGEAMNLCLCALKWDPPHQASSSWVLFSIPVSAAVPLVCPRPLAMLMDSPSSPKRGLHFLLHLLWSVVTFEADAGALGNQFIKDWRQQGLGWAISSSKLWFATALDQISNGDLKVKGSVFHYQVSWVIYLIQ